MEIVPSISSPYRKLHPVFGIVGLMAGLSLSITPAQAATFTFYHVDTSRVTGATSNFNHLDIILHNSTAPLGYDIAPVNTIS
jgi:hypothetical protein